MSFEAGIVRYVKGKTFTRSEAKHRWKWLPARFTIMSRIKIVLILHPRHFNPKEMAEILADKFNLTHRERTCLIPGKTKPVVSNTLWYFVVCKFMSHLRTAGEIHRDEQGYYIPAARTVVVNKKSGLPKIRYFTEEDAIAAKKRDNERPRLK